MSIQSVAPRAYQLEIAQLAEKSNVVAYLDTGAGKTFISVLVLRHRQEMALAARDAAVAAGLPPPLPWKAIFLAPQVSLVEQQARVMARHLPARVKKLVGEDIKSWTAETFVANWREELSKLDILVATPQLVVDLLNRGVVPGIHIFDVLVFDEAHHCKGGHPYKNIMNYCNDCKSLKRKTPRIFGLSAAPAGAGAAKLDRLYKELAALEANLDSRVVTVADRCSVEAVVPQPKLEVERYLASTTAFFAVPQLEALERGIQHAVTRLDIAVALAQLGWTAGLRDTLGFGSITASGSSYLCFEPGAPRFKVTRIKDVLRSVMHVLKQVGVYGAARSTLDALHWLAAGAPDPRADSYSGSAFGFGGGGRGRLASWGNTASNKQYQDGEDEDDEDEVVREPGLAELQAQAVAAGIPWDEVDSLARAATLSTVDVLSAFVSLFSETGVLPRRIKDRLDDARRASRTSSALRDAPIAIMEGIIHAITPADLEQSLLSVSAAQSSSYDDLRFKFPLLTPKAATLINVLQRHSSTSSSQRYWSAIVFAQQRLVVLALTKLLAKLPVCRWLHVHAFMAQGSSVGGMSFHPDDQRGILDGFRSGKYNLLVSTSVAEEGIDIASCQLVIRFDPAPTAQSFHQSRGRARAAGSHLIVLIESGNAEEEAAVHNMAAYQHRMREAALENVAHLEGDDDDDESDAAEQQALADEIAAAVATRGNDDVQSVYGVYVVESTGARMTWHSAGSILQHYVSQLPGDQFVLRRPAWRIEFMGAEGAGQQVQATVRLPSSSPVQLVTGEMMPSKRLAKASAALAACVELHSLAALNDHLLPASLIPPDDDDDDDEDMEEMEDGELRQPKVKRKTLDCVEIKSLPPAVLRTMIPRSVDSAVKEISLFGYGWKREGAEELLPLTFLFPRLLSLETELPKMLGGGGAGKGKAGGQSSSSWGSAILLGEFACDDRQLKLVLQCSDVLRGAAGLAPTATGDVNYALAPLLVPPQPSIIHPRASSSSSSRAPREIDWALTEKVLWLGSVADGQTSILEIIRGSTNPDVLQGTAVITTYNKMMYELVGLAQGMSLSSPFPQDTVLPPYSSSKAKPSSRGSGGASGSTTTKSTNKVEKAPPPHEVTLPDNATFADFYALRRGRPDLDPDQPLLSVVKPSRGRLKNTGKHQIGAATPLPPSIAADDRPIYLVPELCTAHPVPLTLWPALASAPRLLWEIEGHLHAAELLADLQLQGLSAAGCPPVHLIRQALTAPSALDSSLGDYETLEALGDGLLKFAASTQLFFEHPTWHEGQLTATKDRMVSNRKLLKVALKLNLERRVRVEGWTAGTISNSKKRKRQALAARQQQQKQKQQQRQRQGNGDEEEDAGDAGEDDGDKRVEQAVAEEEENTTTRNAKLLADAVEALVGAFYIGSGMAAGLDLLRHLGLADMSLDALPAEATAQPDGYRVCLDVPVVEKALGYHFNCPWLMHEALTHGSVLGQKCYQRLEFLGDAILDVVLVGNAHKAKPDISPSALHDIRSITVNAERLALASVRAQLHTHIVHHSKALFDQMDEFVREAETVMRQMKNEQKAPPENSRAAASSGGGRRGSRRDDDDDLRHHHRRNDEDLRNHHSHHRHRHSPSRELDDDDDRDEDLRNYHDRRRSKYNVAPAVVTDIDSHVWDATMVRWAFGLDRICAPKVLCDIAEALVGAIWLDSSGDWDVAWKVAQKLLNPLPWIGPGAKVPSHPLRRLHELAAKVGHKAEFVVVDEDEDGHGGRHSKQMHQIAMKVMFGSECLGAGPPAHNKKEASRLAAQAVLGSTDEKEILRRMKHR